MIQYIKWTFQGSNMEAWQKGESGNPFTIKPRREKLKIGDLRIICQEYGPQLVEHLVEMIENKGTHETVRFQAVKFMWEQGYGKARQSIEFKVGESIPPNMMTTEQLKLAAAGKTKELVFSLIESGKMEEYIRAYKEGSDINSNKEATSINDKEVIEGSCQRLEKTPV